MIVRARDVRPGDLLAGVRPFHRGRRTRPARYFPNPLIVASVESDTRKTVLLNISPDGEHQAAYRIEAKAQVEIFRPKEPA